MTARNLYRAPPYGVGAVTITLMLLAVGVKIGVAAQVDRQVAAWVLAHQHPAAVYTARLLTFFGSVPWVLGLMAVLSGLWIAAGNRRSAALLWSAWALGALAQVVLRVTVAQWRPDTDQALQSLSLWQRYDLAGFPSGHAFRAVLLYGWLSRTWLRQGRAIPAAGVTLLALTVCATRVYLGRHWISDVSGGLCLAAWALAWARTRERVWPAAAPA